VLTNKKLAEEKIAVVTGSASCIRFENSLLLAKNGFHTYTTVRNPDKSRQYGIIRTK
jgi:NAD(P)-dependent dehydrogenase (short-subunit alcohol dehydrogenase family)